MKAELKFEYDTDDFDACEQIKMLQQAWNYRLVLEDMRDWFRPQIKYEPSEFKELTNKLPKNNVDMDNLIIEVLEKVRDKMFQYISEREVKID